MDCAIRYSFVIFIAGLLGGVFILAPDAPLEPLIVVAFTTPLVETIAVYVFKRMAINDWRKRRLRDISLFTLITPQFVAYRRTPTFIFLTTPLPSNSVIETIKR